MPLLNSFGIVPGITTDLSGTSPLYSMGLSPVTSMILVDIVRTTLAPRTASLPILTPSTTIQRDPIKQSSSMMTGAA